MRKGENKRAIELLQLSLKHEATKDKERLEVLQYLCELHFKEKAFDVCLETGRKLKETYNREKNEKDEVITKGLSDLKLKGETSTDFDAAWDTWKVFRSSHLNLSNFVVVT